MRRSYLNLAVVFARRCQQPTQLNHVPRDWTPVPPSYRERRPGSFDGHEFPVALRAHRIKTQILDFGRLILAWHRSDPTSKRLNCIPGVGPLLATALVASVGDPKVFRSGRNFSAWVGLVPKQHSSGGRAKLGSISKQGDRYLRSLFVAGAFAVIRYAKLHGTKYRPWVAALLARRPTKVAAIALANKLARMAWAMMARGERYNYPAGLRV